MTTVEYSVASVLHSHLLVGSFSCLCQDPPDPQQARGQDLFPTACPSELREQKPKETSFGEAVLHVSAYQACFSKMGQAWKHFLAII